jgi:hypothetical protein
MNDKISAKQLDRAAFIYIRQSTLQQVRHNLESSRRQYELQDRASSLSDLHPRLKREPVCIDVKARKFFGSGFGVCRWKWPTGWFALRWPRVRLSRWIFRLPPAALPCRRVA